MKIYKWKWFTLGFRLNFIWKIGIIFKQLSFIITKIVYLQVYWYLYFFKFSLIFFSRWIRFSTALILSLILFVSNALIISVDMLAGSPAVINIFVVFHLNFLNLVILASLFRRFNNLSYKLRNIYSKLYFYNL